MHERKREGRGDRKRGKDEVRIGEGKREKDRGRLGVLD